MARHHSRGLPRGVHEHDRHAAQLGKFRRISSRIFTGASSCAGRAEKHYIHVSQVVTVLLVIATGYVSAQLASIRSGWQVVLQIGAGTGTVYILRWYWWRINAWSEISAMLTALFATVALSLDSVVDGVARAPEPFLTGSRTGGLHGGKEHAFHHAAGHHAGLGDQSRSSPEPEPAARPRSRSIARFAPDATGLETGGGSPPRLRSQPTHDLGRNLWCWILGCANDLLRACSAVGKILLLHYGIGFVLVVISALCAWRGSRSEPPPLPPHPME